MQILICTANPEGAGAGGKEPAHPAKRHFYTVYTRRSDILVMRRVFG